MKCLFHRSDLDGICSGAIVRMKYPGCTMVGYEYGDEFKFEQLNPKELHVLVDISLPSDTMNRFLQDGIKVIWIDHHYSAIRKSEEDGYAKMRGLRMVGVGACVLTWQYFFSAPPPKSVQMLGEYDVWNHKNPNTIPFHCGLNSMDLSVYSRLWLKLFDDMDLEHSIFTGKRILSYIKESTRKIANLTMHKKLWKGYSVLFINSCVLDSVFYNFLPKANLSECDFIAAYYMDRSEEYRVSLRAQKDEVDVSKIATLYSGGGHKSAAGFVCKTLPWEEK